MATLIACADGNFTAAATWGTVLATGLLDSEVNTVAPATAPSWTSGANFTPGAVTVDGLAVKIRSRLASPTGTFSVRIYNVTGAAAVAGTTVTVNVSDISTDQIGEAGWMFFKFAAPVALAAATNYRVEAQTSNASQLFLYRDATANNMSKMLRTTTTAAPGAGDNLFILGEWTAAATKTDRVVTMDSTAATDYGGGSTTLTSFGISNGGTLTYGTTAATNYVLRLSGILTVWTGGVCNIGTSATPIPRDSTAVLEIDAGADNQFPITVYGTFNAQGLSRTSGKNIVGCFLSADEAAGQTVLSVDTDTGWLSGDEIAIGTTTRTQTQTEARTLNGNATATEVTVSVALTNAHGGTAPNAAPVILLTRNVIIRTTNASFQTQLVFQTASTGDFDWACLQYFGGTGGMRLYTSGAVTVDYCLFRDTEAAAYSMEAAVSRTITHTAWYRPGTVGSYGVMDSVAAGTGSSTVLTLTSCWFVGDANTHDALGLANGVGLVGTNLVFSGLATNVLGGLDPAASYCVLDGVKAVGCGSFTIGIFQSFSLQNFTISRSPNIGLTFQNAGGGRVLVANGSVVGSSGANVSFDGMCMDPIFRNVTLAGDSSYATTNGLRFVGALFYRARLENCSLGVASGINVAHSGSDIDWSSVTGGGYELTLVNTTLASATEFSALFLGTANLGNRSFVAWQRKEGSTNVHQRYYPMLGTVEYETTTFRTASPSEKMSPTAAIATNRLGSSVKRFPVVSGRAAIVSVYVRKSGAYTGSAPRLVLKANPALGIDDDVVLDTLSVGADTWEQLTGTTTPVAEEDGVLEAYVDCDGTAGAVFVDDWSATLA